MADSWSDRLMKGFAGTAKLGADRGVLAQRNQRRMKNALGPQEPTDPRPPGVSATLTSKQVTSTGPRPPLTPVQRRFGDPYMESSYRAGRKTTPDKAVVNVMLDHPAGPPLKPPPPWPPPGGLQPNAEALYGSTRGGVPRPSVVDPGIARRAPAPGSDRMPAPSRRRVNRLQRGKART